MEKELKKLPKGSSALFICVFAFLSGCATNAVESSIPRLSDYELCGDFQRYGMINVNQGLRKEEIEKRGLDCSDPQFASAEADSLRRYEQQKQRRSASTQSGESQMAGAILEGFKNAAEIANRHHQETYLRSDRASGLENLKGLEGWSVVHVGKVTGFIDGTDFSKAESFSFEGCSIGRVLVVDLTKRVVCKGYKYHYAYHPKITVLTKSSSEFKAVVDGQIFDVAR